MVTECEVSLEVERAEIEPKALTEVRFYFIVRGKKPNPEAVTLPIELQKDGYYSGPIMLGETAAITYNVETIEP